MSSNLTRMTCLRSRISCVTWRPMAPRTARIKTGIRLYTHRMHVSVLVDVRWLCRAKFLSQSFFLVCFPKAPLARCLLTLRFLHTHTIRTHSLAHTYSKKRAHASPQLDRYVKTFKNSFLNPLLKEQSRLMREVATFWVKLPVFVLRGLGMTKAPFQFTTWTIYGICVVTTCPSVPW